MKFQKIWIYYRKEQKLKGAISESTYSIVQKYFKNEQKLRNEFSEFNDISTHVRNEMDIMVSLK